MTVKCLSINWLKVHMPQYIVVRALFYVSQPNIKFSINEEYIALPISPFNILHVVILSNWLMYQNTFASFQHLYITELNLSLCYVTFQLTCKWCTQHTVSCKLNKPFVFPIRATLICFYKYVLHQILNCWNLMIFFRKTKLIIMETW